MKLKVISAVFIVALPATAAHAEKIDAAAFLSAHNKWRAEAGLTEKLSYSPALAASAQTWANHLKQTNACQMYHSESNGRYGENLYWTSALIWPDGRSEKLKVTAAQVVDSWGSEKADYDYTSNQCAAGKICGHYTQIVWRTTKTVGCGMAVCEDTHEQVWVCRYQPAGNWLGEKPY